MNRIGQQPQELEEAWIVYSLVREDGLSQVEAAELFETAQELGQSPIGGDGTAGAGRTARTPSRIADTVVGSPTDAVALGTTPLIAPDTAGLEINQGESLTNPDSCTHCGVVDVGNQAEALGAARQESLNSTELSGVVDLLCPLPNHTPAPGVRSRRAKTNPPFGRSMKQRRGYAKNGNRSRRVPHHSQPREHVFPNREFPNAGEPLGRETGSEKTAFNNPVLRRTDNSRKETPLLVLLPLEPVLVSAHHG